MNGMCVGETASGGECQRCHGTPWCLTKLRNSLVSSTLQHFSILVRSNPVHACNATIHCSVQWMVADIERRRNRSPFKRLDENTAPAAESS